MADIRIIDLPTEANPSPDNDYLGIDGTTTRKVLISALMNSVRPFASQAEAEAGISATKTMTPQRTSQAFEAWLQDELGTSVQPYDENLLSTTLSNGYRKPEDVGFNAVGDGVADDTAALSAAVQNCLLTGMSLWLGARYNTTDSIPNLHDVKTFGPGEILRGAETFYYRPVGTDVNHLYVDAAAADDTGDGLSAAQPIKTVTRVAQILARHGPVLDTTWVIHLAAGTYGGSNHVRKYITLGENGLVRFEGPEVPVAAGNTIDFIVGEDGGFATVGETIRGVTSGFEALVISRTDGRILATLQSGTPQRLEQVQGLTSGHTWTLIWFGALPSVIISKAADAAQNHGLIFGWMQQIEVKWMRTSGFSDVGRAGIDARKFCDILLDHFHDDGSYYGVNFQSFTNYRMIGCAFKNNVMHGISELFFVGRTLNDEYSICFNSGGSLWNSKEFTAGHSDTLILYRSAEAGLEAHSGFTSNVGGLEIYACPVGVCGTGPGELHVESAIVWGTGANACDRKYVRDSSFLLLSRTGWNNDALTYRPLCPAGPGLFDGTTRTKTGDTNTLEIVLGTIFANEHATKGQYSEIEIRGKRVIGSNGTGTFRLSLGGVICSTVIMPTTTVGTAWFRVKFNIMCYQDGDFQRFEGSGSQEGASGAITGEGQQQDRTETWVANDKEVKIQYIPGHASDNITINDIRWK